MPTLLARHRLPPHPPWGGRGYPLGIPHCTLAPFAPSRHFLQKKDDFSDDFSCAHTVFALLCTHEFDDWRSVRHRRPRHRRARRVLHRRERPHPRRFRGTRLRRSRRRLAHVPRRRGAGWVPVVKVKSRKGFFLTWVLPPLPPLGGAGG